jgi:phosphoserine phosphatase RsbU/P
VGLGLYIVSEIAKAHGGKVAVRSSAEAGTEFEAVFPR